MTKMRRSSMVLASVMTLTALAGCGGGKWNPPGEKPPKGYQGVFSLPFEGEATAEAGLIQPGASSAYSWDSAAKPNVQIWYDNADTSTNVCLDSFEREHEDTSQGLNLSMQYISEFYSRIINTSREYAGSDHLTFYTLSGPQFADLQEAGNNTVTWNANPSFDPVSPGSYVRSLEMEIEGEGADLRFKDLGGQSYTVLSDGVLRQLYGENGKITADSFKNDINVVFSDIADVDLTSTELAEMIANRLKEARADGSDVSLYCFGVKLPYSGWISVPDRVHSLNSMTVYRQSYVYGQTRSYYFIITGPTAAAELYTRNLITDMGDRVPADTQNSNGFRPQSMFVMDPEEESGSTAAEAAERLISVVPFADEKENKNSGKKAAGKKKEDSEAEAETTAAPAAAAESDFRTYGFLSAEEADMLACFRGSDTGDIAKFAEQRNLDWKKFMSCVYLDKDVYYPAELLTQLNDTENKEIMGAKLYQAKLEKVDSQGKEMNCTWLPVSAEEFDATGNLVALQNEAYVSFEKQNPNETYAWMMEIDLADRIGDDPGKLVEPDFLEHYTSADIKNNAYFSAPNLGTFAETIIRSNDQRVTEKYYVLIILKHSPTTAKNTPGAKNRKDASSQEDTPVETTAE